MTGWSDGVEQALAVTRREVADLHAELVRYGLVVWTAGNVSARVPGAELFVIKPSGVSYQDLTPDVMIVCDLDGVRQRTDQSRPPDPRAPGRLSADLPRSGPA